MAGRFRVISLTQITSTVLFTDGAQQLFLKYQQIYIQLILDNTLVKVRNRVSKLTGRLIFVIKFSSFLYTKLSLASFTFMGNVMLVMQGLSMWLSLVPGLGYQGEALCQVDYRISICV